MQFFFVFINIFAKKGVSYLFIPYFCILKLKMEI